MSKEAFLTELAGHLKVLEEREQQDILDEYAQHIDMKIQNGMSEEEAHKYLERQAMDRRMPRADVAREVLDQYEQ